MVSAWKTSAFALWSSWIISNEASSFSVGWPPARDRWKTFDMLYRFKEPQPPRAIDRASVPVKSSGKSKTVPSAFKNSAGPPGLIALPVSLTAWLRDILGLKRGASRRVAPCCLKISAQVSQIRSIRVGSAPKRPSAEPVIAAEDAERAATLIAAR